MNFSHSALFHIKTRVFLKYFVRACRFLIRSHFLSIQNNMTIKQKNLCFSIFFASKINESKCIFLEKRKILGFIFSCKIQIIFLTTTSKCMSELNFFDSFIFSCSTFLILAKLISRKFSISVTFLSWKLQLFFKISFL